MRSSLTDWGIPPALHIPAQNYLRGGEYYHQPDPGAAYRNFGVVWAEIALLALYPAFMGLILKKA